MGKLLVMILLLCVLFVGCGSSQTLETVMDTPGIEQQASALQIVFNLPEEAAQQTMEEDDGCTIYFCEDFELITRTVDGGDLSKTILNTTGFDKETLEIIETKHGENKKYVCTWVTTGEEGNCVGRCAIIDDGAYHYVLSATAEEHVAGELAQGVWKEVFNSFRIAHPQDIVNSGS